jgi:hypothetical protein
MMMPVMMITLTMMTMIRWLARWRVPFTDQDLSVAGRSG